MLTVTRLTLIKAAAAERFRWPIIYGADDTARWLFHERQPRRCGPLCIEERGVSEGLVTGLTAPHGP